jgi:hypothetical protein
MHLEVNSSVSRQDKRGSQWFQERILSTSADQCGYLKISVSISEMDISLVDILALAWVACQEVRVNLSVFSLPAP